MGIISIEKTKKDVSSVYAKVLEFKKKFPGCVAFRLKKHASVVERHLNPGEVVCMLLLVKRMIVFMILLTLV